MYLLLKKKKQLSHYYLEKGSGLRLLQFLQSQLDVVAKLKILNRSMSQLALHVPPNSLFWTFKLRTLMTPVKQ